MIQALETWLRRILFLEILQGMAVTFRHLFVRPVTFQYPHTKRALPSSSRGIMSLLRWEDGSEKCVGCGLCEVACPSEVIRVVSAEQEGMPLKRYAREYYFDLSRCVFCGFCVEACPVDALAMTPEYELSVYNKRDLRLDKAKLLEFGDRNFPIRPKKPEYQGSCEGEEYLAAARARGYPEKKGLS